MNITYILGGENQAKELAEKNGAIVIPLFDYYIGDRSFLGFIGELADDSGSKTDEQNVVISFELWELTNKPGQIDRFIDEIITFCLKYPHGSGHIAFVGDSILIRNIEAKATLSFMSGSIIKNSLFDATLC